MFGGCAEDPAECGRAAAGTSGPTRTLIVPFFLEIFSGTARVSKEMARLGFLAIAIDTRFGTKHDMCKISLVRAIRGWIMSGFVIGIHFGTPCISWSRARTRPNGPQPLRNTENILGLPVLRNEGERWKIEMGNTTMKNTVSIALVASLHMVPFCI